MNITGWAFKKSELELRDRNSAEYKKIQHLSNEINLSKKPCYGKGEFSGKLNDKSKHLTEFQIALIADRGNLCFGGDCTKRSDGSFSGCYYTD